jgi:hypothetical protein
MAAGVGKLFKIGRLPVNTQVSGYYYIVRPDFAPNWQIRAQVQFMFPKELSPRDELQVPASPFNWKVSS